MELQFLNMYTVFQYGGVWSSAVQLSQRGRGVCWSDFPHQNKQEYNTLRGIWAMALRLLDLFFEPKLRPQIEKAREDMHGVS